MENNIQKEIQERHENRERLNKIALELFEQLKDNRVTFSDAKDIIRRLNGMVVQAMEDHELN